VDIEIGFPLSNSCQNFSEIFEIFGGKISAGKFLRENFCGKISAEKFWRENYKFLFRIRNWTIPEMLHAYFSYFSHIIELFRVLSRSVGIVASMRCEQTLFSKVNDMAII
jgi:hypothetical protein